MILLHQIRRFFLAFGLIVFISTATAFSFVSGESWAATSLIQGMDPVHPEIALMDQAKGMIKHVEDKAQAVIGNMTNDAPNNPVAGKAQQLEDKTRKAINNSIENPNYQPGRKTTQAANQDRETRADIQAEVREAFQ